MAVNETSPPLHSLIRQFTQTPTWGEAAQLVSKHPELSGDDSVLALEGVCGEAREAGEEYSTEFFEAHLEFLRRLRAGGDAARPDADEEGDGEPPAELDDALRRFAEAGGRYNEGGGRDSVAEAVDAAYSVIEHARFSDAPPLFRQMFLNNAGFFLLELYRETLNVEDLRRALELWRRGLSLASAKSPLRALLLNNMGSALRDLYEETNDGAHLDEAVAFHAQAVTHLLGPQLLYVAGFLHNLGNCYRDRYEVKESPEDLDRMVDAYRRAVEATAADSPELEERLGDLARALYMSFRLRREPEALEEAVGCHERAARLDGSTAEDRAEHLARAGLYLMLLYLSDRERLDDLDKAVDSYRESAANTADPSAKAERLTKLHQCLLQRYERTAALADLEERAAVLRDLVGLHSQDEQEQVNLLYGLAEALYELSSRTGEPAHLDDAVETWLRLAGLMSTVSDDLPDVLRKLLAALSERHARTGSAEDLKLMDACRRRLAAVPAPEVGALAPVVFQFVEAESWGATREFLEQHPELFGPGVDELIGVMADDARRLGNIAAAGEFETHRALLRRCREVGAGRAFGEKLLSDGTDAKLVLRRLRLTFEMLPEATRREMEWMLEDEEVLGQLLERLAKNPQADISADDSLTQMLVRKWMPEELSRKYDRALEARMRFYRADDEGALKEAAALWQEVLGDPKFSQLPGQFVLDVLGAAGNDFYPMYEITGRREYLDLSISLTERLLQLLQPDDEDFALTLNNLGLLLHKRFDADRAPEDLRQSIKYFEEALRLGRGPTQRAASLTNLGRVLTKLYETTRERGALERALPALGEAVGMTDADDIEGLGTRLIKLGEVQRLMYRETGEVEYLDGVIDSYRRARRLFPPEFGSDNPLSNNLYIDLIERYERRGDPADLESAVELARQASPPESSEPADRIQRLNQLASGLRLLHARSGGAAPLEEALDACRQAMELVAPGSADEARTLDNIELVLHDRYQLTGDPADLDGAVEAAQRAVSLETPRTESQAGYLNNLANSLHARYTRDGNREDLDRAINAWQEALEIIPAGSPEGLLMLNNLSGGLRTRYHLGGDLADLGLVIEAGQRILNSAAPDSPDRWLFLNNLGNALRDRYVRTGSLIDLERAVEYYGRALSLPEQSGAPPLLLLMNFGASLIQRYERMGDPADLDRAIEFWQRAADLCPPNSPEAPLYLGNLAGGLLHRYARADDPADLDRAIGAVQTAVRLVRPGSTWEGTLRVGLGDALMRRAERDGNASDLDLSVRTLEEGARLVNLNSPRGVLTLAAMGNVWLTRYEHGGDPQDLGRAIQSYREACQKGLVYNWDAVFASSRAWMTSALARGAWGEVVEAYGYGSRAVEHLFGAQVGRAGREAWLREARGLSAGAAYAHARLGEPEAAAQALEAGRARLLADALERARRDLELLTRHGRADLYERYRSSAERVGELERSVALLMGQPAGFDESEALNEARAEVAAVVAEIQRVPGYEDFFRHMDFPQIREVLAPAADEGGGPQTGVYLTLTRVGGVALVVHAGGVETVWLDLDEDALAGMLVRPAEAEGQPGGYLPSQYSPAEFRTSLDDLLAAVGERVMKPVASALRRLFPDGGGSAAPSVRLIPTGLLSLLPLHAADCGTGGSGRAFLEDFEVSYTPSARVLARARGTAAALPEGPPSLFALANPLPLPEGVPPLGYARTEVEEIARLFGGTREVLFEAEATRASVVGGIDAALYLHFSCHGSFDMDEPLESGLLLSGGEWLTLSDLIERRASGANRLAVLSACQTAITDFGHLREEAVSLLSGFLQSGAAGVVGSLWPVNDLSTALLMIKFYEYHLRGDSGAGPLPPLRALRRAQLWLRGVTSAELSEMFLMFKRTAPDAPEQSRVAYALARAKFTEYALRRSDERPFAHPYYWAAFVFYGV